MKTPEQALKSYQYGLENFYPDDGEAHLVNAQRRYLGQHIRELTPEQRRAMSAADALVGRALKACVDAGSWEQDNLIDLNEYLDRSRAEAVSGSFSISRQAAGGGDAGRIGQGQIALIGKRFGRLDLQLARLGVAVIIESALVEVV
ncbi:hypothetical protein [uncultured Thiocystis sp.]|jgi:hypothetical protein|uniref:hypothetical protein n=1 Tax=uncultured Thiocystis sp. TaxID=1202134 RepID=UPI0025F3C519|nr:hypothetical protein [uncultured Thiocystis sp.]